MVAIVEFMEMKESGVKRNSVVSDAMRCSSWGEEGQFDVSMMVVAGEAVSWVFCTRSTAHCLLFVFPTLKPLRPNSNLRRQNPELSLPEPQAQNPPETIPEQKAARSSQSRHSYNPHHTASTSYTEDAAHRTILWSACVL
jgi:hypothetical protein